MSILDAVQADIAAVFGAVYDDATLTRDVAAAGPNAWTPGAMTPTDYPCKAMRDVWDKALLAGGLVDTDDLKIIVTQLSLAVQPHPGDRITLRGVTSTIVSTGSGQAAVTADPASGGWILRTKV